MNVCLYSGCAHMATEIINNSSYKHIQIQIIISTERTILFFATRIRHQTYIHILLYHETLALLKMC
jgi:hypothetical protein